MVIKRFFTALLFTLISMAGLQCVLDTERGFCERTRRIQESKNHENCVLWAGAYAIESDQPLSEDESKRGGQLRARAAIEAAFLVYCMQDAREKQDCARKSRVLPVIDLRTL